MLIRVISLFVVALVASKLIPYLGNFPYLDLLLDYKYPHAIYSWASFDGAHYINIGRDGYHQYDQAFFPLYPTIITILGSLLGKDHLLAGLLTSYTGFFIGGYFLFKLMALKYGESVSQWMLIFLIIFPTSFFFTSLYTEGIFLMLTALSLYCLYRKKLFSAAFFAILCSLTRLQGILLIIPFFFYFYDKKKQLAENIVFVIKKHWLMLIAPLGGLLIYMVFLQLSVGDPLFFFNSQPAFNANRSTSLILLPQVYWRYFKIFFQSDFTFQYLVALSEFVFFNLAFVGSLIFLKLAWRKQDYFGSGMAFFSLAHILLPPLTGTFSSMPRYVLFAWALFLALAQIKDIRVKIGIGICFVILQIILASLFVQGYFVS